ncbi:hypothetical protein A2767_00260 [Candidatus Roizmanbacteria bacterium RIFCSPHIGHO2_01_FULL_35_10]|uniref:Uncharacterized protein n=1 Tax=Candidatus Roizmanbacteria bacterium RIFCSPLOWO2_01_FULL_35_13 TaxID=1802055 RepID=A0A1F7IHE4_9BACT|nr:MAG: hypothetical protein A2767_00260 [Candidatus Roizmanbacteria bacterium RIFCSPHIGHO2_01_FULL_35_10]OGK42781.1 MAG: hypothetical protein A3A74_01030 [Candidatus Roizmanbacteria bacterium RIFCSPLOWO2_01_FULL_35_13]
MEVLGPTELKTKFISLYNKFTSDPGNCKHIAPLMNFLSQRYVSPLTGFDLFGLIKTALTNVPVWHDKIRKEPHDPTCYTVRQSNKNSLM